LGEGDTPLTPSRTIGPALGLKHLYFKNESVNPTWSFKDRYVAVSLNMARRFGFRRVVVSSTGNLGVSAAAYAAAFGFDCVFLAPPGVARPILDQAALNGAHVVVTDWNGRLPLFEHLALNRDWFPLGLFLDRTVSNPFGVEGYRSFAYEMVEALGEAPAAVLFPCARGNGLYGCWKGFADARNLGWSNAVPRLFACQPEGANSLEVSMRGDGTDAIELPPVVSVAFSTMETVGSSHTLIALRESGGGGVSATDDKIVQAVHELGREGLAVEPSSALPVACLPRLIAEGKIDRDRPVVAVLTAAGIKWPDTLGRDLPPPVTIAPESGEIDRVLLQRGLAD
jgi:threonine synthase